MTKVLSSYEAQIAQQKLPAGQKKVLIAAIHLFASRGFHATTTAEIAKEAQVSEGTIYKYYSSKRNLLNSLLTPLLKSIRDNFIAKLDETQPLDKLIQQAVEDRIQFGTENFDLIKILVQEILTSTDQSLPLTEVINGTDGLAEQLSKLKDTYPFINQSLTTIQMLRIIIGPLLAYVSQICLFHLTPQDPDWEHRLVVQQIMAGLTCH